MKNIIIFGAGSAIAQATGRLWAKEKAQLVLIDRDQKRLQIVADDLKTRGADCAHTIMADLVDTGLHSDILQQATDLLGDIDITLIAYGTLGDQKAGQRDFEVARGELATNFLSVISILTLLANQLERQGSGTLAVISSVAGDRGRKSNYIYGTAKGALTIFLQGLRNRLSSKGVQVLTIKPGFVDTPMTADFKKGKLWVKPDVVARGIIKAITQKKRMWCICPGSGVTSCSSFALFLNGYLRG